MTDPTDMEAILQAFLWASRAALLDALVNLRKLHEP